MLTTYNLKFSFAGRPVDPNLVISTAISNEACPASTVHVNLIGVAVLSSLKQFDYRFV